MNRLGLAASVLLALSSTALAQPGAPDPEAATIIVVAPPAPVVVQAPPGSAEAPPPPMVAAATSAPQNEPWSNVSHVNGTLVPIGERGNYLIKWKKTNISSNPLGWLMGFYGLSVSQAINGHVAIRGDANLFRPIDSETHGYEFGATLPLYFKRVYQGPFIEPGLIVRDLNTSDGSNAFVGPQVNFGWHWTFDSGMNVAVAFGLARRMTSEMGARSADDFDSSPESPIEPVGYFRVGYAY